MIKFALSLLNLLAHLPLRCLYVLSDITFVLLFYVVRYRRRVVRENMALCLPELDDKARARQERQFYRNFADYFFETVKLAHISDKEISRRMEMVGLDIVDRYLEKGRSVAVCFGHTFNWEWGTSITLHSRYGRDPRVKFCQVYRPLRNHDADRWFLKLRSRFHSLSLAKSHVFRDLLRLRRDGCLTVTGFMSDQKPSHDDPVYVVRFLNRPTAVITGTETLARKLGMAVVYWDMEKPRRGHYRLTAHLLADNAAEVPADAASPHPITVSYLQHLEATIRRQPSLWLWTHKRWKNPVTLCQNPQQQ